MPWDYLGARDRIRSKIKETPLFEVQNYAEEYYPIFLREQGMRAERLEPPQKPLFDLPSNRAITVSTVQLYVNIVNYEDYRLEDGLETEFSHGRALQFLHLHYSACDRVVENTKAQRVDFHSSRMHAVVLESIGANVSLESVVEALHLAKQLELLSDQANRVLADGGLGAKFRIGIDAGPCVAINSGNGKDKEPLFLGSAANHAAKLADGDDAGIFLSDRVRAILNLPLMGSLELEKVNKISESDLIRYLNNQPFIDANGRVLLTENRAEELLGDWQKEIASEGLLSSNIPNFQFHYKVPPLSKIVYADLYPSNSIRMNLSSVFADLDGYTAYIDHAMITGRIPEAVMAIDVIRSELQSVLEQDFGGRKIRFIGDCIHGVLAEGSNTMVSSNQTIRSSALCAGALRSSFEICQDELSNVDSLGLAIGIEFGETPISRIGIRGERGVRVASSGCTISSENLQRECNGKQTKFGENALSIFPTDMENLVDGAGYAYDLSYDDVAVNNVGISIGDTDSQPSENRSHCENTP